MDPTMDPTMEPTAEPTTEQSIAPLTAELIVRLMSVPLHPMYGEDDQPDERLKTWGDYFKYVVRAKNWHREGGASCPHDESVYEHLVACGEYAYKTALDCGENDHVATLAWLAAFLHDIGKPGTQTIKGSNTAFKGHSVVGAALIGLMWSTEIYTQLGVTRQEWASVAQVAASHMCYLCSPALLDPTTMHAKHMSKFHTPLTRRLLKYMREADMAGRKPVPEEWLSEAQATRDTFAHVLETAGAGLDEEMWPGALVMFNGASGSGKTRAAAEFAESLVILGLPADKVVVVSRDEVLVRISHEIMKKPDATYAECYKAYSDSGKAWADKIDREMKQMIQSGLGRGCIVLTDTLATMHEYSTQRIIGDVASRVTRISVWCYRRTPVTQEDADRHGFSLERQRAVTGTRTLSSPFPPDIKWANNMSVYELGGSKAETSTWCNQRPHIQVTRGWDGVEVDTLMHVARSLVQLNKAISENPRVLPLGSTVDMPLLDLVQKLYDVGGWEHVSNWLGFYGHTVAHPRDDKRVAFITYLDWATPLWTYMWAIEARGVALALGPDGKLMYVKRGLRRGAEVLDQARGDLNEKQRAVVDALMVPAGCPLEGTLSGKVDGSLCILNVYRYGTREWRFMSGWVRELQADLSKQPPWGVLNFGDGHLMVVSTNGTLFAGDTMREYLLTAFTATLGLHPDAGWGHCAGPLADLALSLADAVAPDAPLVSLAFEAVCANRTARNGVVSTELAVSYPKEHEGLWFLGAAHGDGPKGYTPHYDIKCPPGVRQPHHIRITHSSQIPDAIIELETRGGTHPEGYIFFDAEGEYHKVKTPDYYRAHKVKGAHLAELLAIPECVAAQFANIARARSFVDTFADRMHRHVKALCNEAATNDKALKKLKDNERAVALRDPAKRIQMVLPHVRGLVDDTDKDKRYGTWFRKFMNELRPWQNDEVAVRAALDAMVAARTPVFIDGFDLLQGSKAFWDL